jgi:ATP-dependent DNA helicase RecG
MRKFYLTYAPSLEKKSQTVSGKSSPKPSPKIDTQLLDLIRTNPSITTSQLGSALGISKRTVLKKIDRCKKAGILRRVEPARGGHWEVSK